MVFVLAIGGLSSTSDMVPDGSDGLPSGLASTSDVPSAGLAAGLGSTSNVAADEDDSSSDDTLDFALDGCDLVSSRCTSPDLSPYERTLHGMTRAARRSIRDEASRAYELDLANDEFEATPMGVVRLTTLLGASMDSVVWAAETADGRQFVAKYGTDCRRRIVEESGPDLASEYSLLCGLNDTDFTPKAFLLSAAARIDKLSPKTASGIVKEYVDLCTARFATVRMILIEKVGMSIQAYLDEVFLVDKLRYLRESLIASVRVMELVQRLHERGVVHRDLHLDNVMFRAETESWTANDVVSGELVLIDFGLSVFFPDTADFGLDWYVDDGMSPWLMSPWQLDKVRAGRRDDLFRVLEMLAMNLGLGRFDRGVRRLSRRMGIARHAGPQLRAFEMTVAKRYKNDCNFFLFDETLKSEAGENVSDSVQRLAMQQPLEAALSYVRSIAHPDDEPNYELVSQFMKDALLAIQ